MNGSTGQLMALITGFAWGRAQNAFYPMLEAAAVGFPPEILRLHAAKVGEARRALALLEDALHAAAAGDDATLQRIANHVFRSGVRGKASQTTYPDLSVTREVATSLVRDDDAE